jgi:hypothetical protein
MQDKTLRKLLSYPIDPSPQDILPLDGVVGGHVAMLAFKVGSVSMINVEVVSAPKMFRRQGYASKLMNYLSNELHPGLNIELTLSNIMFEEGYSKYKYVYVLLYLRFTIY